MLKVFKNLVPFSVITLLLLGCSQKDFHNEMADGAKETLNKNNYGEFKSSYSSSLVDEKEKSKEFISILEEPLADYKKQPVI